MIKKVEGVQNLYKRDLIYYMSDMKKKFFCLMAVVMDEKYFRHAPGRFVPGFTLY